MNYERKTLAEIISEARENIEITQRELARRSDVNHSTIERIEKGIVLKPTIDTLSKIAKTLNLDLDKLIDICYKEDETENNINSFIVTRTKENAFEFDTTNFDLVIDFLIDFNYEINSILPNIGDKLEIKFNGENYCS